MAEKKNEDLIVVSSGIRAPFSQGVLSQSLIASGVDPENAYSMATDIREILIFEEIKEITARNLYERVYSELEDIDTANNTTFKDRYKLWHDIRNNKEPILILLGGASGIGTTTVATDLGYTLGINRVIGTDVIREIERKIISYDLLPQIHVSSFEVWRTIKRPIGPEYDRVILGFRSQVEKVMVGVEALIARAITEGIPMIIEGVHIVPGFLSEKYSKEKNLFMFVLNIDDPKLHKMRLKTRGYMTIRGGKRYMKNFQNIRKIQNDIIDRAHFAGVPIIDSTYTKDAARSIITKITDEISRRNPQKTDDE